MKYLRFLFVILSSCSLEQFTERSIAVDPADKRHLVIDESLSIMPVTWATLKSSVAPGQWILLASADCPGVKKHFKTLIEDLNTKEVDYTVVIIDDYAVVPAGYSSFQEWGNLHPIYVLDEEHHGRFVDIRVKSRAFINDLYGDASQPSYQAAFLAFRLDDEKNILLHSRSMGGANSVQLKEDSLRANAVAQKKEIRN